MEKEAASQFRDVLKVIDSSSVIEASQVAASQFRDVLKVIGMSFCCANKLSSFACAFRDVLKVIGMSFRLRLMMSAASQFRDVLKVIVNMGFTGPHSKCSVAVSRRSESQWPSKCVKSLA